MKKVLALVLAALVLVPLTGGITVANADETETVVENPHRFGDTISYKAKDKALAALQSTKDVTVEDGENIIFTPTHDMKDTGFIFYPGAMVEPEAYSPIMKGLAEKGYKVVVTPMPANFALLDSNKADKVIENNSDIKQWVIGGHSLGGVSAAKYAVKNDMIKGVVFYASYPQGKELKDTNLKVLSLWGSNDKVAGVNLVKFSKKLVPAESTFIEIEGGNHGQFGDYGKQLGDGTSTITPEEQWSQAIAHTSDLLESIN